MSTTQSVHGREVTPRLRLRSWIVPLAVPVAIGLIVAIVGLVSNGATSATTPRITSTRQASSAPAAIVTAPVQSRGSVRDPVSHALVRIPKAASNPAPPIRSNRGAS